MTVRRALAWVVAGLAAATVAVGTPVSALEKEPVLTVGERETVEAEYSAIPVGAGTPSNHPDDCVDLPDCDVIRLKIVVPERLESADTAEDFFVRITLSWTQDVEGPIGTGSNDMDMYVWEDPAGDDDLASGASSANPERASLVNPRKGDYSIVVANFAGTNRGYKLHAEWITGEIVTPYEALEPGRSQPKSGAGEEESFVPPEDFSGEPVDDSAFAPVPVGPVDEPVAAPASPISGDDAFGFSLPRAPALRPSLSTDPDAGSLFDTRPIADAADADPVPVAIVLFWLVAVPATLVAAAFLWLRQHRPVALVAG
jgi:hypothetical protein